MSGSLTRNTRATWPDRAGCFIPFDQLVNQGFSSNGMSAADFSAFFKRQYDGFVTTVKEDNVKFE